METIFKVLSDLKIGGELKLKGTFFSAVLAECEHLVADGILKAFPEVATVEEAIAADMEATQQQETAAAEAAANTEAQNTWGPTKEEAPTEAAPDTTAPATDEAPTGDSVPTAGTVGEGDVPPPAATDAATSPAATGDNL